MDHPDAFLDPRRETGSPLRWSRPEQWHVTLAFMPAVPERVAEALVDGLGEVAARHDPATFSVTGGGCFPDVTRAQVLWAGVVHVEPGLPG